MGETGDRRIVTALFADLVDYVRLVAEHDAEEVQRLVDEALAAMVDAIARFDGTPEKFIGDAVFAVFGWPVAHDDDALRAAHCGLAIRAALASLRDPSGEALQVHIGIATGEVVAAPRGVAGTTDWSLTGPAVTTAARLQGVAQPGEILVDDATIRAARKGLTIEDLGERVLRGQTRPVRIGRLIGEATFQPWRPPAGPFVGRTAEREAIGAMLDELALRDRGGLVLVEGEPGIGKSRLIASFEPDARRAGLAWTWVDNVSYGGSEPYRFARSLAQAVADEFGTDSGSTARQLLFTPDADPADVRVWAGAVAAMARDAAFSGWEAEASLVPRDPGEVARAMRSVAVRYIERLLEVAGPRVIVVDDLHWLDVSSAGVFDELIAIAERLPLLLLVASRPDSVRADWLHGARVRTIRLVGLDEPETGELAAAVAGAPVAQPDVQRLHARTGGNPLFIGETVRAIVDEGALTSDGRLAIGGADGAAMPVTLRALLGGRIDALSSDCRTILRVAAVLGMSFAEATVEDVVDRPVDPTIYERLADAAMIVPIDAAGGWRFCHPLIHDAAYSSLLASDRRTLHARVADEIQRTQPDVRVGVIAGHRAAAGDPGAVPLLIAAAEQAIALGAGIEAGAYLDAAAELASGDAAEDLRARAAEARGEVAVGGR
ncbi:MAG TPA: adenylate/guanylate cyclase domain-containing protein [Candidatus Limnocylindrales bacterium]|nr:adenylate/guanylate cyclase domain-containing protein [Candidatus Limnocylindrales bacterium]